MRKRGLAGTAVLGPRSLPAGFPRGGEPAGHWFSPHAWIGRGTPGPQLPGPKRGAWVGRARDSGFPGRTTRRLGPQNTGSSALAHSIHPPRTLQATLPENLCICIWLSSAPEPPNRTRREAPFSGWPSRPPRQPVPSLRPHSVPRRLSCHLVGPTAFLFRLFLKLHNNFLKTTVSRSQCI